MPRADQAAVAVDAATGEVRAEVSAFASHGEQFLATPYRVVPRTGNGADWEVTGRTDSLFCGPRWNEAIGLRVCDLNPLRQEATIGRVVVNQNGAKTFTEAMSKTEDARTVPVPDAVMTVLVDHIKTYLPDAGREDFLFLTTRGTHPMRGNFGRDVLRAGAGRAGLGERHITWLTLRHTAASLMFDAGMTIFEVQHRLGHKSPTMTAEVYTHLMRERFNEGRTRLEAYMNDQRQ